MCRELGRLGALREEARASGKAWFAKLTLTLTGFGKPKPERGPSLSDSRISPLGWLELMKGSRSSPGDSGLKAGARATARSPGATVSGPRPVLLKCGAIADTSWVSCVFCGFPGGLEWRAEPPGALRGDRGEGVRTLQSVVMSPLWGSGAARAGGHRAGGDFPQGPDRGQSACPGDSAAASCANLGQTPFPRHPTQTSQEAGARARLELTSGASAPCAARSPSWLPSPFLIFKQFFSYLRLPPISFALVKPSVVRLPPTHPLPSGYH